jgi:hypothetical protein
MPKRRATWDTVGDIVSALPGTELGMHLGGAPAWRVNGKVIVLFGPRMRTPDEEEQRKRSGTLINIVTGYEEREALMLSDPDVFFITPHYETNPSVLCWLDKVDVGQLRDVLTDAWRYRAPKRIVRAWETGGS